MKVLSAVMKNMALLYKQNDKILYDTITYGRSHLENYKYYYYECNEDKYLRVSKKYISPVYHIVNTSALSLGNNIQVPHIKLYNTHIALCKTKY